MALTIASRQSVEISIMSRKIVVFGESVCGRKPSCCNLSTFVLMDVVFPDFIIEVI